MKYALSIDIGGTNTRVSLISEDYKVKGYESFRTDGQDPLVTMNRIKEVIDTFEEEAVGIGVSCPGPLDLKKGIILTPPNLPGWHNFELVKVMSEILDMDVLLENDANLAGLAEATIGAGKDLDYVQYLTVSTGLGGGFVINKEIYQGSKGFAQELANVILVPGGFSVGNLVPGSLESYASGTGITERARLKGLDVEHAGEVNDLAKQGNEDCILIIKEAQEYLANAIAMLYAVLDPEIVILGGSVALKMEGHVEAVEKLVKEKVFPDVAKNVKLQKAKLGEDNGILGGAILAFNESEKK